ASIKEEYLAAFSQLYQRRNARPPAAVKIEQQRLGRDVVIPHIMIDRSECPALPPRLHVERHDRGGMFIDYRAAPTSPKIRGPIARRQVNEAQLLIHRELDPP